MRKDSRYDRSGFMSCWVLQVVALLLTMEPLWCVHQNLGVRMKPHQ